MKSATPPIHDSWAVYKRLLKYLAPLWVYFVIGVLGMAANAASEAGFAVLMKFLIQDTFIEQDASIIQAMPFAIIGLFLVRGSSGFIAAYFMARVSTIIVKTFRQQLFDKYLYLPTRFYDATTAGALISRVIYQVDQITGAITTVLTKIFRDGLKVMFLIGVMFYWSPKLAAITLLAGPLIVVLVRFVSKRFRRLSHRTQDNMAGISNVTEEVVTGQRVVKLFGGQPYESARFAQTNEQTRKLGMKVAITNAAASPLIQLIAGIALSFVVYIAINDRDVFNAGIFASFMVATGSLLQPLKGLTDLVSTLQKGLAAAEEIFQVLDQHDEQDTGKQILRITQGKIDYRQASFTYDPAKGQVLHNIDLSITGGETIALVGRSGSGKSTLASLLPRLYELNEGEILIDGQNTRDVSLHSLRDHIALVSQDVVLFNDTVKNNIAYGRSGESSDDDIIAAAKAAYAWEFIDALPEGLNTIIGERGVMLSGGQRQRLSIARAILKNAPILILDEATAALDTESERKIQAALDTLMQDRTTLVIAHRLSTIEKADRIIVMQDGHIAETGTHQKLLEQQGIYANLHRLQFADTES